MSTAVPINRETRKLEIIADYACEIGENPLWHPTEHRLYWCDIVSGRLFRYDPETGTHEQCHEGRPIGGFTIQDDGSLLLFMDRGAIATWSEGSLTEIVAEIPADRESRFNDVIADPLGRVFCGTMSTNNNKGRLYRLDLDGSLHLLLENIGCSNGMAFTLDGAGLYYTDSLAREIYLFDYCSVDGSLSNRRIFVKFSEDDGLPDGATLDAENNLWSALWGASCIVCIFPNGQINRKIVLPTPKVSSLTFGGDDYTDLYITTGGGDKRQTDGPLAGSLFHRKSETRGLPQFLSRIRVPESSPPRK